MKRLASFVILAAGATLALSATAADIGAGQAKVKEVCQACHGLEGKSISPEYPNLAGQYPDYLAKALRDYQAGRRKNAIMQGMAATLKPADIDNVAAYYSSQPALLRNKPR